MTRAEALAEGIPTEPVVLPLRWRHHNVCAILRDRAVTWVARDILEAVEGDAGDYGGEPGHTPLVVREHVHASTWTLDQTGRFIGGLEGLIAAERLLDWMRERESSIQAVGFGNVIRMGTQSAVIDGPLHSVADAATLLANRYGHATGVRRLFEWLLVHGWITRRGSEYAPAQSAVDAGLLAVRPRRIPNQANPWPQIVLTAAGLTELHLTLSRDADQEQP